MKNYFYFIVLTFLTFLDSNAQDKGNFEFGASFGLNISNVSELNSNESTPSLTSINLGLSGEYYFSDRWGIKLKIIDDRKGWTNGFFIEEDGTKYTTDYNLNYITVPVLANWHFGSNRNWYLNFGPYVGFLVSAKETKKGRDVKEALNSNDFGIGLGIGYKFVLSDKLKMVIDYDSQSGLNNIFKVSNTTIRNGRSSFNLGVLYSL